MTSRRTASLVVSVASTMLLLLATLGGVAHGAAPDGRGKSHTTPAVADGSRAAPAARQANTADDNATPEDHESAGDNEATEDNDGNDGGTPNNVPDEGDNAHPSGNDRSVENGQSGNQGNTSADPDDDGRGPDNSNGGVDQPGGDGGTDPADQDGNNGCGNDDDFEDDNEGRCAPAAPKDQPVDEPTDESTDEAVALGAPLLPTEEQPANATPPVGPAGAGPLAGSAVETPISPVQVAAETLHASSVNPVPTAVDEARLPATGTQAVRLAALAAFVLMMGAMLLITGSRIPARVRADDRY